MTDDLPDSPAPAESAEVTDRPLTPEHRVRTGVETVDEVIAAVEELEERPIEEHVGVFTTAQEQLRRALDAQEPQDAPDSQDAPGSQDARDLQGPHGSA